MGQPTYGGSGLMSHGKMHSNYIGLCVPANLTTEWFT